MNEEFGAHRVLKILIKQRDRYLTESGEEICSSMRLDAKVMAKALDIAITQILHELNQPTIGE